MSKKYIKNKRLNEIKKMKNYTQSNQLSISYNNRACERSEQFLGRDTRIKGPQVGKCKSQVPYQEAGT